MSATPSPPDFTLVKFVPLEVTTAGARVMGGAGGAGGAADTPLVPGCIDIRYDFRTTPAKTVRVDAPVTLARLLDGVARARAGSPNEAEIHKIYALALSGAGAKADPPLWRFYAAR